jgi:hypothetical protein
MNTKDAFKQTIDISQMVVKMYLGDLSDADLLTRPVGCNHLAWQLGHLISSEVSLLNGICPGKGPELPPDFAARHSKETTGVNDPQKFCTKKEYLDLLEKVSTASKQALDGLSDADLDAPSPEHFRPRFPTVGSIFTLIATHPMMHAGQIAVARRMLGKPVVI